VVIIGGSKMDGSKVGSCPCPQSFQFFQYRECTLQIYGSGVVREVYIDYMVYDNISTVTTRTIVCV